ncbi:CGNR zinc finger domain-containing protein [Amycolatopsis sp. PS_44_ISF1]|uniref:CGNR zinc finger domain-containing protein n=1 Tax=Amycolatopsis sp. PS_44_ISF1 TaxID=2974917 RepID=UPI0028DD7549|nr:CGNR zinc finger domain-containing protein [Amycolatopsis sp. PS_44_ISF1]MDT8912894.1 CGNR zinc finger domain-containing protein [Amycolatopsis sp. PS_44_ISF1]
MDRPLLGEPLGLDLLNTTWIERGGPADLLTDLAGMRLWLRQNDLDLPVTEAARSALVTAREAIRAHTLATGTGGPVTTTSGITATVSLDAAREGLNSVLAWGRHRPELGPSGPAAVAEVASPDRRAGWLAAVGYLELLTADPTRVRHCAHPECVLYFYDTSPKRSRRWCSMATCGNRAKAARHYARTKD